MRLSFQRCEHVRFISHLDLMRLWERALRRAGVPLAYSEGFTPHPRLALAAPLPIGVTSEAEIMDIYLMRPISTNAFLQALRRQLPAGIEAIEARSVPVAAGSLQSQVRFAEYEVGLEDRRSQAEVQAAIDAFQAIAHLPWKHRRESEVRHYDLRALVEWIRTTHASDGRVSLVMRVRCDGTGAGRPEQVAVALGFTEPPSRCHRLRLVLDPSGGDS